MKGGPLIDLSDMDSSMYANRADSLSESRDRGYAYLLVNELTKKKHLVNEYRDGIESLTTYEVHIISWE